VTVTTPLGRVLREKDGIRLEYVRTYPVPVEDVWSALTEPDRLARWIGTISGDPTTGQVEFLMTEEGATPEKVPIVECVPPTRLVVDLPSPGGLWRVSATLTASDGVTTLVFTQRLAEPDPVGDIGPGWQYYLDRLGAVIAGQDVPDNWDDYYPSLSDAYPLPG